MVWPGMPFFLEKSTRTRCKRQGVRDQRDDKVTLSTHKKLGADGKVSYIRERWTSEGGYQRCGATSLEVNDGMSGFPDEAMSMNGHPCVIPYADRYEGG